MSTATITLDKELAATLERLAKERSVTVEFLILEFVAEHLSEIPGEPSGGDSSSGVLHGTRFPIAGKYRSDGTVSARDSEEYLRTLFANGPRRSS